MSNSFEVLPFGGEFEMQRYLPRGGALRSGARRLGRAGGPGARRAHGWKTGKTGYGGHGGHGGHGPTRWPRHYHRFPYGGPYLAPYYAGWSYPWGTVVNVFDDGLPPDNPPDDNGDAPQQDGMASPQFRPCDCPACRSARFDVLPFTMNRQALMAGKQNWRSRRL